MITINYNTTQGRKAFPSDQLKNKTLSDALLHALDKVEKDVNCKIYTFTIIKGDYVQSYFSSGRAIY